MPAFCRDFEDDACPISDRVVAKLMVLMRLRYRGCSMR